MAANTNKERMEELRNELNALQDKRQTIEDELVKHRLVLDVNKVDMRESLTDKDDFPRVDIDVFAVRHARAAINKLEFDVREIFNTIQSRLEELHALSRQSAES